MLQQRGVVRRKQNRAIRAVSLVLASAMGEYLHRVMRLLRINFEKQKHLRELERLIEQGEQCRTPGRMLLYSGCEELLYLVLILPCHNLKRRQAAYLVQMPQEAMAH